jgi:hypothetical protein
MACRHASAPRRMRRVSISALQDPVGAAGARLGGPRGAALPDEIIKAQAGIMASDDSLKVAAKLDAAVRAAA